jgi:hypothetical protein
MVKNTTSLDREVGALEVRIGALETDMRDIRADVRVIRDVLVGLKSGWRTLTLIVAISASLGAGLARLSEIWPRK